MSTRNSLDHNEDIGHKDKNKSYHGEGANRVGPDEDVRAKEHIW